MLRIDRHNAEGMEVSRMLQRGVYIAKPGAMTVSGLVCHIFGITEEERNSRIKTLMLNNSIVDKPETTTVNDGDTLMLSGAMPGLVGAMLRADSPFKAMRESITAGDGVDTAGGEERYVKLKMLNTVLSRYREAIIDYGFWVEV